MVVICSCQKKHRIDSLLFFIRPEVASNSNIAGRSGGGMFTNSDDFGIRLRAASSDLPGLVWIVTGNLIRVSVSSIE